jgi:hypothetical protein
MPEVPPASGSTAAKSRQYAVGTVPKIWDRAGRGVDVDMDGPVRSKVRHGVLCRGPA